MAKRYLETIIHKWNFSCTLEHKLKMHTAVPNGLTQYHEFADVITGDKRRIAYEKLEGPNPVGVIFIPGFLSCKAGTKATHLYQYCKQLDYPFVRYDPMGLGESSHSIKLKDATFSRWIQDAEETLLNLTKGPQIVVGSSMGGWIACHLAKKYPEKFGALLLIAPGLNFTDRFIARFRHLAPESVLKKLDQGETVNIDCFGWGETPMSWALMKSFKPFEIQLDEGLKIDCPVRIIHGLQDADVPYEEAMPILKALSSKDAQLKYIKDGQHTLSEPENLRDMCSTVRELNDKVNSLLDKPL